MSAHAGIFAVSCSREQPEEAMTLQRERQLNQFLAGVERRALRFQLNQFLAGVERRALRFAEIAVRDRDEALDLVQDAMIKLVERRALRFAEIAVRDRDEALDLVQDAMIKLARNYAGRPEAEWTPLFYRILQNGIRDWHRRQMVRNRVMVWFGRTSEPTDDYDPVAQAPDPMGRTPAHYSRAVHALREVLGEYWQ
jgi:DNA-directed RNA polymerase specialized sigma24 family protein